MFRRKDTIYFVQRLTDMAVKIGYSGDHQRRIGQVRTGYGAIRVLGTHPGNEQDENALHLRFADICIGGGRKDANSTPSDWFFPEPKLLEYIEANAEPYDDIEEIGMRFTIPLATYNRLHLAAAANSITFAEFMRELVVTVAEAYSTPTVEHVAKDAA